MATFNVKLAPTFRNYVAEQDKIMPNFLQSFQFFGSTPPNSKFSRVYFYLLKRLQWLLSMKWCTYFEMICSWVRGHSNLLDRTSPIFPWKSSLSNSLNFKSFFTSKKTVVAFNEPRAPTSRKYLSEEGIMMPNLLQILQCFRSHFSVFTLENYPKPSENM